MSAGSVVLETPSPETLGVLWIRSREHREDAYLPVADFRLSGTPIRKGVSLEHYSEVAIPVA